MDCCTSMAGMALGALGTARAGCMIGRRACRPHAPCIAVQCKERAESRAHQVTARRLRDEWRGPRAMMSSARINAAKRLNGVAGCSGLAADCCGRHEQGFSLWQARGPAPCGWPRVLPGPRRWSTSRCCGWSSTRSVVDQRLVMPGGYRSGAGVLRRRDAEAVGGRGRGPRARVYAPKKRTL